MRDRITERFEQQVSQLRRRSGHASGTLPIQIARRNQCGRQLRLRTCCLLVELRLKQCIQQRIPDVEPRRTHAAAIADGEAALDGVTATPDQVIAALFSRVWDVIHVASHGVLDWQPTPDQPPHTGIVLGAPPLDVIESGILAQLPEPPALAFLNCCHLGSIPESDRHLRRDRPALAASLAVELIEAGCPAVVACGWAVDDGSAMRFARTLYTDLCGGQNFGAAVRHAREVAHDGATTDNTLWREAMGPSQAGTYSPHRFAEDIEVPLLVIHGVWNANPLQFLAGA